VPVLDRTLELTRTGGTVMVYGMTAESARWSVSPYDIFRRELTIKGSFAQQYTFDRALTVLRTGRVDTAGMITHRFALAEYDRALAAVASSQAIKTVIVP
jgi:D-arabinitol dehydrogenase (NADP+)